MKRLTIEKPIWNGRNGREAVGIADYRLVDDLLIDIEAESKGEKLFPGYYYITKERAKLYPTQRLKGTNLHIIPIKDFEMYPEDKVIITVKKEEKSGKAGGTEGAEHNFEGGKKCIKECLKILG